MDKERASPSYLYTSLVVVSLCEMTIIPLCVERTYEGVRKMWEGGSILSTTTNVEHYYDYS